MSTVVIRAHCSPKNYAHKCELGGVSIAATPLKWPIELQKYGLYINEEGMNELENCSYMILNHR